MIIKKLCFIILLNSIYIANSSDEEEKLLKNKFKSYNKLIRPVQNLSDFVEVKVDLVLLQLINVYEKEQIMKTNVWIDLKWTDFQLTWSKDDYKVNSLQVPFDKVWTPDIVLFNNADGKYEASYKSNAVLYPSDSFNILCVPPAIYKSSCTIDVTYFPFDEQVCEMRLGSWTFDATQVRLIRSRKMANLENYLPSGTWDVIDAPSETIDYTVDGIPRMELIYKFRIRRKTLFYTVNLIIPTVLISFLSIFVFYLPTDEGEKITLSISILLALVVFLVLVSRILPPTSIVIPLIAKYLLFTFIMNILTILNTVIIINHNHRTPRTHDMPKYVKKVFIEFLPKLLFMSRPKEYSPIDSYVLYNQCDNKNCFPGSIELNEYLKPCFHKHDQLNSRFDNKQAKSVSKLNNASYSPLNSKRYKKILQNSIPEFRVNDLEKFKKTIFFTDKSKSHKSDSDTTDGEQNFYKNELNQEITEAATHINFITNHMKSENDYQEIKDDWKFVALVIDRMQLYIFFIVTLFGTAYILLKAPHIFEFVDQQEYLKRIIKTANEEYI